MPITPAKLAQFELLNQLAALDTRMHPQRLGELVALLRVSLQAEMAYLHAEPDPSVAANIWRGLDSAMNFLETANDAEDPIVVWATIGYTVRACAEAADREASELAAASLRPPLRPPAVGIGRQ